MPSIVSVQRIANDDNARIVTYDNGITSSVPLSGIAGAQISEWVRQGGVVQDAFVPPAPQPTRDEIILRALIDNTVVTQEQINAAERNIRDDRGLPTTPDVGGGGRP